jgi:hypothetical protein
MQGSGFPVYVYLLVTLDSVPFIRSGTFFSLRCFPMPLDHPKNPGDDISALLRSIGFNTPPLGALQCIRDTPSACGKTVYPVDRNL